MGEVMYKTKFEKEAKKMTFSRFLLKYINLIPIPLRKQFIADLSFFDFHTWKAGMNGKIDD